MTAALLPSDRTDPLKGIGCMVLAVAIFTIMDAFIKWLAEAGYSTMQLIFFRSFFAFVPLFFVIFRSSWREALVVRNAPGHLIRCLVGITSMAAFFYAYKVMPLADVVAIGFAAPIFVTALSVPLLGEKVGIRRWSACLVGFAGVLLIVRPGAGLFESGALIALAGTVFYAGAAIAVRHLSRTDTSASIVFYFTLTCTLVSAAFLPFEWKSPDLTDLVLLILVGLLGGTAQLLMTTAFRSVDIAVVMPFEYTAMLWSVGIGYAVWGDVPGLNVWIGALFVIASGFYIVRREARLRRPHGS